MRTIFSRRFPAVVLSLLACAMLVTVAYASHWWGGYHWARTGNPFMLNVGDNVTSAWDSYLDTTVQDWSVSAVLDLVKVAGGTTPRKCRPTSGRVEVCNEKYGNNGWLGIASVWASGSHITQASVKLNDTYFNTAAYNTPAWRNLVMCQEVGHTLGLDHQDENFGNTALGTCMDYSSNPDPNQHPNTHDYEMLETIYAHLDSTTTVGSSIATSAHPPAMNNLELDGPGQWGRLVSASRNGQAELYELDFGGGHKIFTFVIWAHGAERGRGQ
jgi:hypothetical protein